ncbi:MAG TPA: magnesium-translocating P-type ATPase, partial [Pyrinomonadaceae bacterium]|nr:magnesium-translocating P-type ATPase [Pyrinomonadaceae bacterium]
MNLATSETSPSGLTQVEAKRRLTQFGPNEPAPVRRTVPLFQLLILLANPLAIILLVASGISAALGEVINASIIVTMVLFSVALNFIQTYRSQKAVDSIRKEVAPTASVLRDSKWIEIPRREIVPGDVIKLAAGDLVPADAELLQTRDLHVQQAALTGESLPVEKSTTSDQSNQADAESDSHKVFLGTSVVSGSATAVVTATGQNTVFGDIAARLAKRAPETEFERGTRRFGFLIMRTTLLLVLFVLLVSVFLHRPFLESLLFAVALAVGLTPEFLPVITTVTLGRGAVHMARKNVIVKHLEAMQNFGSIDVLCSDKTGTLTSGEMALQEHLDPFGAPCEPVFVLAYLNSLHETGIANPLDQAIKERHRSDPLDSAVLKHDHPDIHDYVKVDEIPFDFERRRVSIIVKHNDESLLITKGAPESVLSVCTAYEVNKQQFPLATSRARIENTYRDLCAKGYRSLAVAYAKAPAKNVYTAADETGLVLAGFLSFTDPALPTAQSTLLALQRDGIQVKILTGDNELVTQHICAQVGLDSGRIVLGTELEKISDPALAHIVEQTSVFARVSPVQKNRIILALKNRSHVVGYLGDGINDAPSLHAADVGISVSSAVDVAKDAADFILLEPGLDVLHAGIIEGRKSFGNVMKYLLMGTSSNFGNMFSMAVAVSFLPFLPLLPTQILLNNFLYD